MADPRITLTAVDQTRAAFASLSANFDALKTKASAFSSTLAGLTLGGTLVAGLAGLKNSFSSALAAGDQLNKLSQRASISVERLSELKFAAELSDVSLETLGRGIKDLQVFMVEANDSTSEQAKLLRTLGVTAKEPNQALLQIADAFKALGDSQERAAASQVIFKRSGQELIPLLAGGRDAIEAAAESARKLGITWSTENAKAAEEFNDNLKKLSKSAEALGVSLTSKLVKGMADYTGELVKAKEEGKLWNSILDQGIKLALKAAEALPGALGPLAQFIGTSREVAQAAENQRLRASGTIARPETADPDIRARTACTLSGGTWDAKSRRCVPKATGGGAKGPTFDELMAQAALKRVQVQDDAEQRSEAEVAEQIKRESELRVTLEMARLEREDAAIEAAGETIQKNKELAQSYLDMIDPVKKYRDALAEIERLSKLTEAEGGLTSDQAAAAIERVNEKIRELSTGATQAKDVARDLGLAFQTAFEDAIVQGEKFRDVLKGLAQDILRLIVRKSVTEPLAKAGTKLLEGIDWGKIFGFASGGSFMVGGSGGTDSQLVAFKASPNERVTVETPEQQRASSGAFHQTIQIDARGADAGVEQRLRAWSREIMQQTLQAVQAQADRGGSFARAVGRR